MTNEHRNRVPQVCRGGNHGQNPIEKERLDWFSGKKLIILFDMIRFLAADFAHDWQWLRAELEIASMNAEIDPPPTPTDEDINRLLGLLRGREECRLLAGQGLEHFCERLNMTVSAQRIEHFSQQLKISNWRPSFEVICAELLGLKKSLWREMKERKFTFIPLGKVEFLEQENLFWEKVTKAFPSAGEDIKSAGNCIVHDFHTSAVVHLMRIMEFGLQRLYKSLRLPKPSNPNWAVLLDKIEKEIAVRDKARPPLWTRKRDFYIEAAQHFRFFKDKRNRAVHVEYSLRDYDPPDAATTRRVFEEVKHFTQHLATKLKE